MSSPINDRRKDNKYIKLLSLVYRSKTFTIYNKFRCITFQLLTIIRKKTNSGSIRI